MRVTLKKIITPSLSLSTLLIVASIALWLVVFSTTVVDSPVELGSPLSKAVENILPAGLLTSITSLLLTLLNAFLIAQLNNRFTIIRNRTFIPVFVFLMLMSVAGQTHQLPGAHFALTLLLIALFVFFNMFRDKQASEHAFLGSLLIATGSLFIEPILLFLAVCWMGMIRFGSFSLRTFLASVFGGLVPWIFYFTIRYYFEPDLLWINTLFTGFETGFTLFGRPVNELIYLTCMTLIIITGLVGLYSNLHGDSIQSRAKLNFLTIILIFSFAFSIVFVNCYAIFIPFTLMAYAVLIAHPLTLKPNGFYAILFIVLVIINLAYLASNLILR